MDIKATVCQIVEDIVGYEAKPEDNIVSDLNGDSLDLVQICMEVEKEFDLNISDEDYTKWRTVQDVIDYVEQNYHAR